MWNIRMNYDQNLNAKGIKILWSSALHFSLEYYIRRVVIW